MICKRWAVIFFKTIIGVMLNLISMFIRDLVKSYRYSCTIFISVYAESFKSIGMLAYRVSFCYAVDLKFVQMLS